MSLPNILYKYRDWKHPKHKRIITSNEIYFTSSINFNDPFDSNIDLRYDLATEPQILQYYKKHFKKAFPELEDTKINKMAAYALNKGYYKDPGQLKILKHYLQSKREKEFGICTLSATNKNILMWSHYSNKHKGICVGFDTKQLLKYRKEIGVEEGIIFELFKVKYSKNYPILVPSGSSADDFIVLEPFKIKSDKWEYEKEYRLILITGTNLSIQLPSSIITVVIMGCKMSWEHKEELISILREKTYQIDLYQATMKKNEFGLELEVVNYN